MTTGFPRNPDDPGTSTGRDDSARANPELPAARLWLADGYNLLHCAPFRSAEGAEGTDVAGEGESRPPFWSTEMRERLVAVARRFTHPHDALWVVFDGPRPNETSLVSGGQPAVHTGEPANGAGTALPELHVCFAPSADDWIVGRVKEARRKGEAVAVVTGDRKLGNRARHHQAAVVSPRLFLAHCDPDRAFD
ncbi:MAG: NYN domain-containing protein [Myxococcota bacterium]|jgi:hypothetical protein|nr:NYN domain-containing protein [Myxococcota bacterium]